MVYFIFLFRNLLQKSDLRPKTQPTSPNLAKSGSVPSKIVSNSPKKRQLEKIFTHPFKRRATSKAKQRNLMNHSGFSQANINIKKQFEKIMMNQKVFESNLSNSRSRCSRPKPKIIIGKEFTEQTAAWTALKTGDMFPTEKSVTNKWARKLTAGNKSRFTDQYASRFDITSESPTKTDKSFLVIDNPSTSKNDLDGIHEVLERIEQTEQTNKKKHLRVHRGNKKLLGYTELEVGRNQLSIHDRNHPMNLSVSSMNSICKSRDSRIGLSSTPNNDLKSTVTHFKQKNLKKSHSPIGKLILGRNPSSYMKPKVDYQEYWSAKTSKRVYKQQINKQRRNNNRSNFLDKRRCNTKIFVDVLAKLDEKK